MLEVVFNDSVYKLLFDAFLDDPKKFIGADFSGIQLTNRFMRKFQQGRCSILFHEFQGVGTGSNQIPPH